MLAVVGSPSRVTASDREAHPDSQDWLGVPPGGAGVLRRTSRIARTGQESFLEGREWSGGPPDG